MKIYPIKDWNLDIPIDKPLVIAGPCSAESEEQTLNTAKALKEEGINIFRAGIWKPRTRPNCFEGVGNIGLPWLETVKKETGMLVSTEVASVKHLEQALKHNVDMIWIGARTTANPFAIQDIADALVGTDIPVFVKNPVNPDLELWIGAIERIAGAGLKRIGAIHRGFSAYENSKYRNIPQWQIPIELRQRIKDLSILCDPSHITGDANLIKEVSQEALDLNYDGLIIESHINPHKALSDAKQQITPKQLSQLLEELVIRDINTSDAEVGTILNELRYQIDSMDSEMIDILGNRIQLTQKIGQYKKENNITILQEERWKHILDNAISVGKGRNLSEDFISKIFKAIHQESINKQTRIMNE
ncbi:MAG: bifunctional 3-deoxy-7-phosphoheptulonate synthase/chorismate mutase type II [Marinifilaceae bacterium]